MLQKSLLLSLIGLSLHAGGYLINENSVNSTALSGANVAHSHGSDAAYFNPANMVFMENQASIEASLHYFYLTSINYKSSTADINSKEEKKFIPSLHYVSNDLGGMRVGFCIVSAAGLAKRWEDAPAVYAAEEFSLETIEFNPSIAYLLSKNLSVAIGIRGVYSTGKVKSTAAVSRDLKGRSIDFGYNLALSYKPSNNWDLAMTYRSKVDLTIEGSAKLYGPISTYQVAATVNVPIPASLTFAVAYNMNEDTTIEFLYEKDFWSAYDTLDFNYERDIGALKPFFDYPKSVNWNDSDVYRLGLTHTLDKVTLMGGITYSKTPIPESTLGYELPGMDKMSVSFGASYDINTQTTVGLAMLHTTSNGRTVTNPPQVNGTFSNATAYVISTGIEYKF